MATSVFPTERYINALLRLLQTIGYDDKNHALEERIHALHHVYLRTAAYFAGPSKLPDVSPKYMQKAIETVVTMVVYSYPKLSLDTMSDLSIYYTYAVILDDTPEDADESMRTFFQDLVAGRPQKHPWWQHVNRHLPSLLQHYGPFCSLNIFRSTLDFFQGCWIEKHNFQGFPGSHDYPKFLRRLNGLGHAVGATLFPKHTFDERQLFSEITSAIAQMENWEIYLNDLISFYKESNDCNDQSFLINNYCNCEDISIEQALDKLTLDVVASSMQLRCVFQNRNEKVWDTIDAFMQGYVTWHLTNPRYRLADFIQNIGDTDDAVAIRGFWKKADEIGGLRSKEWAYPHFSKMMGQTNGLGN